MTWHGVFLLPPGRRGKLRDPRHELRQAPRGNRKRSAKFEQLAPKPKQELRRGQRLDEFGRDMACIAVARTGEAGLVAINQHDPAIFARQSVGNCTTDNAGADNCD